MIFSFYIFLFAVALVLIFLGYYTETDVLKIVSYGLIFMLGYMLIAPVPFGSVQDCEYLVSTITNSSGNAVYSHDYTCQDVENRIFGFWISVLSVLGFATVYFQRKGGEIET